MSWPPWGIGAKTRKIPAETEGERLMPKTLFPGGNVVEVRDITGEVGQKMWLLDG